MKQLPIGRQDFQGLITENQLYVDKTSYISRLINSGKYLFLSRPRRFGKSLLISTLKYLFVGKKELFKDLYIYDRISWREHPVIHIDFSKIAYTKGREIFEDSLKRCLADVAQANAIPLATDMEPKEILVKLIETLADKQQVVVLIDEYDKPIVDYMHEPEKADENREILGEFYSVLKACDPYLRLIFRTKRDGL